MNDGQDLCTKEDEQIRWKGEVGVVARVGGGSSGRTKVWATGRGGQNTNSLTAHRSRPSNFSSPYVRAPHPFSLPCPLPFSTF
ncbi:hypothetical protein RRG08_018770 [Elysia crispata]|uniref:Uncharacterized protein n=1 Tax=Elysia crispata TaxID=231223 RepID=A0AAE0ZWX8_9GAST|nr:hypothetical protein RRG08_018770 [Elysia crispata]